MTFTLAFDLDGVLRNLVDAALELSAPDVKYEDITYFDKLAEVVGGGHRGLREELDRTCAWEVAAPYRAMLHLWGWVDLHHVKPIIVTSNSHYEGMWQSIAWMRHHLPRPNHGLEIHFADDKLSVKYDAIIEDKPENVRSISDVGRTVFVPHRPWTQEIPANEPRVIKLPEDEKTQEVMRFWLGKLREGK